MTFFAAIVYVVMAAWVFAVIVTVVNASTLEVAFQNAMHRLESLKVLRKQNQALGAGLVFYDTACASSRSQNVRRRPLNAGASSQNGACPTSGTSQFQRGAHSLCAGRRRPV